MLIPVRTSGNRPPLFFIHGVHGAMLLGSAFASVLGPDQPLYVINANGIDGRKPVIDNVHEMVLAYIQEIDGACPLGLLRVAGMCSGCFLALEVARSLQGKGRETGPVILADPPQVPYSSNRHFRAVDPKQPTVARQLYEQVRSMFSYHAKRPYNDMPFDLSDPQQANHAIMAGVASLVAFAKYIPTPFLGPTELIISAERAPGFFHPQMIWHKLLPGPRVVHVLPWDHMELFRGGRIAVARLLKFILEEPSVLDDFGEPRFERNGPDTLPLRETRVV